MVKAVFLDMDNTLIETQEIYEAAHLKLAAYIQSCGVHDAPEKITERNRQFQLVQYAAHGYGKEMLPAAYADTLRHFVPDATPAEINLARQMAMDVYTTEARIKTGIPEALDLLSRHFVLYLVTVGDADVQAGRIAQLPFRDKFAKTFVVGDKNADAYKKILDDTGHCAADCVMIGDSLASDIIPSVASGMAAIHIPAQNWHGREMAGQARPDAALVKTNLTEAAAMLVAAVAPAAAQTGTVARRKRSGFQP